MTRTTTTTASLSLNALLRRIEEFEISLTAYYRFAGYSGRTEHEWDVKLEKSKAGELDLRAQAKGDSFEAALRLASARFFSAVDSKIDFQPALAPPVDEHDAPLTADLDDEIPF